MDLADPFRGLHSVRMRSRWRPFPFFCVCALLFASIASMPIDARAQGSTEPSLPPPSGPLVLRLSPTARTTALGGAWVAGRDQDVLFFNPAQLIGARAGLDVAITRHGPSSTMATLGS